MGTHVQSSRPLRGKKHLLLAALLAAVVAGLVLLALNPDVREAVAAVLRGVRNAGPVAFFVAMALLPAVGFPMLAFTLAAGPVFGPNLGAGWVILWSMTAVVANLLLSYWLASRALRPLVSRLLAWLDFRLPESPAAGGWQLTLIVRLAPGPPYWVQSYLLGLLRVPLLPYLVVSTVVMAGFIVALVLGGDALASGQGHLAFVAAGLLVVTVATLQLLRQRTVRRTAAFQAISAK